DRRRASGMTSALNVAASRVVTVRSTPLTVIESPRCASAARVVAIVSWPRADRTTVPTSRTMPVNTGPSWHCDAPLKSDRGIQVEYPRRVAEQEQVPHLVVEAEAVEILQAVRRGPRRMVGPEHHLASPVPTQVRPHHAHNRPTATPAASIDANVHSTGSSSS